MTKRPKSADVQLKVRMKEPLRADLEKSARQRGVTLNAEIVRRLEDALTFGPPHVRNVARVVAGTVTFTEAQTGKKYTESRETFMALQIAIAGIFGIPFIPSDELSTDSRKIGEGVARKALAELGQSGKADQWIEAMILPKLLATEKLQEITK